MVQDEPQDGVHIWVGFPEIGSEDQNSDDLPEFADQVLVAEGVDIAVVGVPLSAVPGEADPVQNLYFAAVPEIVVVAALAAAAVVVLVYFVPAALGP